MEYNKQTIDSNEISKSTTAKPPALPPRPDYGYLQFNPNSFSIPKTYERKSTTTLNTQNIIYDNDMNNADYGQAHMDYVTRFAIESSLGAFRTFETVLSAINSLAGMLSTTHSSIFILFKTFVNAIEQFSRLKAQFLSLISPSQIFQWFRRILRFFLSLFRLRSSDNQNFETLWSITSNSSPEFHSPKGKRVNLAAFLFWLFALIAPYFLYKLFSSLIQSIEQSRKWALGNGEYYKAKALFDFARGNSNEISFRAGEILRIAPIDKQPKIRGWLLASTHDGNKIGLVPMNYIEITERIFPNQECNHLESTFDEVFGII